jgi:hypothetical protein
LRGKSNSYQIEAVCNSLKKRRIQTWRWGSASIRGRCSWARMQDLTKTYQWPILISESTQRQVEEEFETEFVDSVLVKGKTEPVNTYKLIGRRGSDQVK